jgi:outer membrane protein TolC
MKLLALAFIAAAASLPSLVQAQVPDLRIGVVIDGPWELNDDIRDMIHRETSTLTADEFDVLFPADKDIVADWTTEGVRRALDTLLADPQVDLVIASGVLASIDAIQRGPLPKPVIAPFAIFPEILGLPITGGSGIENLSYVTLPSTFERDLQAFREIVPITHLALLVNAGVAAGVNHGLATMAQRAEAWGVDVTVVPVSSSIDDAMALIPSTVDAVYLAPMLHIPISEHDRLLALLIERRLPSFSVLGRDEVERGALVGLQMDTWFPRITRRIALNVQRILLGEPPGQVPVEFRTQERLVINMATARAINRFPPYWVLIEAETLHETPPAAGRQLDLHAAVHEAIRENLDLAANERAVTAGAQEIPLARSRLLPQLEASTLTTAIDEDRAEASFGIQPERRSTGTLALSQLLFSEPAWANLSIQRRLQSAREYDREALQFDIAQAAATAYLNVLQAKTTESVERDNLSLTRRNLEMAQSRQQIGIANPSEVYRWESEVALSRRRVIDAVAVTRQAEIALARLLHRPLRESFELADVTIEDPSLVTGQRGFFGYVEDQLVFDAFSDFLVKEGLAASPEIHQLDALIAASERSLRSATSAFFSPTVSLQAQVDRQFEESGAGAGGPGLQLPTELPTADDTNWSVGLNLSIPLWTSGSRLADRTQASEELFDLRLQRAAAIERVEQRIRTALEEVSASFLGIQLANDAAVAAAQSLELVSDGYARGVVSILDVLDAQNAALTADLAAAASVYQFLIDLMEVERAISQLDFFMSPEAYEAWFQRLDDHFESIGIAPR